MSSRKANAMLGQPRNLHATKNAPGSQRTRSTTIAPWDEPSQDLGHDPADISPWEQDPQAMIRGTRPFNQSYFNDSPRDGTPPPRPFGIRQNTEETPDTEVEARRPSVASNETRSSISSRASGANGKF